MDLIPHNPSEGVYSTGGDWVHALEVRGAERMLFVSGTMGLRPDFTAPPTLDEQLECVCGRRRPREDLLAQLGAQRELVAPCRVAVALDASQIQQGR